ncbi:protein phosphatase 2C domain-containing protein [Streptomyces ficellus]|uniref:protein phosphatase 2C domain-containing protein n=1 Tax=Streptomyces ficellus TaxID=1977088 RepID=UPI00142ECFCF|nr:protein phosphatase 2C domain-containing protein [Streptomyces ficellus]
MRQDDQHRDHRDHPAPDDADSAFDTLPNGVSRGGEPVPRPSVPDPRSPARHRPEAPAAPEYGYGYGYGPGTRPEPVSPPAPAPPAPAPPAPIARPATAPAPGPAPATAPVPDRVHEPAPAPTPTPTPAPALAAPPQEPPASGVPRLGEPWHSGARPPRYPPRPGALPGVREDLDAAVVPDIVLDGATHGPLTVRAASVRGDSHRWEREPRQDALCVTRLGGGEPHDSLLLLAVADGVGSAARSHVGSQTACRTVAGLLDTCAEQLVQAVRDGADTMLTALVSSAVGRTAEALDRLAAERGEPPAAFSTTLRALLVPLDPAIRNRGFFAVGDGGLARLRGGAWDLDPTGREADGPGGGVIDTRTAALPTARHTEAHVLGPAAPGDVLVLSTDGLSSPLAGERQVRDFLAAAWGGEPPEPADFLWQTQFRAKSYDDDRTAVCLWEGP